MVIRQILHILFLATCFAGCLYHVLHVSKQYFSYRTTTRVNSKLQDIVKYPIIVFCAQLTDMIDPFALPNRSLTNLHNLTIRQLLNFTPLENKTIHTCGFRDDSQHTYIFNNYTSSHCSYHFRVKKVIVGNLICYQIYTRKSLNYSIYRIANAIDWATIVYNIDLSEPFSRSTNIFMPAFYPSLLTNKIKTREIFPALSRQFAAVTVRSNYDNWIIMRPYAEDYQLLAAPYDTNCTHVSFCYRNCIIRDTISLLNLFPFSEPANKSYGELKLLSSDHLKYSSTFQQWKQTQLSCKNKCSQLNCRTIITSNVAYTYTYYEPSNLTLSVSVPGTYFKTISSIPDFSLIEYISSLTTCISIWFGFSALSVNPFQWVRKRAFTKFSLRVNQLKIGRRVYFAICFIGFTYQLSSVCDQFFKFQTSSRIEVSSKDTYKYQTLGTCFQQAEILNRTDFQQYNISQTVEQALANYDEIYNLNIDHLFELSPKAANIMKHCSIRHEFDFRLNRLNATECSLWFSVKQVVKGEHMCYFFIPRNNATFSWTKVTTSFKGKGRVYEIVLNLEAVVDATMLVISYQGKAEKSLPTLSRNFAQLINYYSSNLIQASSLLNVFKSLPSPYDTKCLEGLDQDECNTQCIIQEVNSKLDRVPFSEFVPNQSKKLKQISYADVLNKTFANLLWHAQQECWKKCTFTPCFQTISFTDSNDYYNIKDKGRLRIISTVPKRPTLIISSIPATTETDFLLYICNCFGIWFGLSFLTCNPYFLWIKIVKLRQRIKGCSTQTSTLTNPLKRHSFKRFLVVSFCVCGFGFQCFSFSITYFRYKTNTRIEITATDVYRLPNIVFCTQFTEVISQQRLQKFLTRVQHQEIEPTVKDLHEMTPNDTLVGCGYRFNQSEEFQERSQKECGKIFKTIKYASGGDICYDYISSQDSGYSVTQVTSALDHVGIIYELYLNESLTTAHHLYFISYATPFDLSVTSKAILPIRSRKYGETLIRGLGDKLQNYFMLQGTIYNVTLLQAPYDTGCLPDDEADFCEPECNTQYKQEKLERVPFREIMAEPSDFRMISEQDLENDTVKNIIKEGNLMCSKRCTRPPCDSYYSLTDAFGYFKADIRQGRLVLAAGVPQSNGLIVRTFPAMQLIDFLNNLAISASIWFGVSILSLCMMPVNTRIMTRKKNNSMSLRVHRQERIRRLRRCVKVVPEQFRSA